MPQKRRVIVMKRSIEGHEVGKELLDTPTAGESLKDTENQVHTLVADLVEGMWAQRRRVIELKQRI